MWATSEAGSRLKIRITPAAEHAVRQGHPWVYGDKVRQQNRPAETGEIAVIYDRSDRFLALALYDLDSAIRLRILHHGAPVTLDEEWWRRKLRDSLAMRQDNFGPGTTGYRLINGENDGWPALILDQYGDTLVLKIYAAFWLPRLPEIEALIREALAPRALVLRLSRNLIARAAKHYQLEECFLGTPGDDTVTFLENDLTFEAEVRFGQKTGFFLDQRENRQRVESLAAGQDVLNAFSFSGGFSLYAARGGARSVTDLDISPHALESARRNFANNASHPAIAAARHESHQADAFAWLAEAARQGGPRFGLVITDPPSLAKREAERDGGIEAYHHLALNGLQLLQPGGTLLAASCSAHVSAEEFRRAVERAAHAVLGRDWRTLWTAGHAPDHPVSFREGEYLKAVAIQRGQE
jgi:23S rRNA (cytosine1962-C5)-methyltransferase